MKFILRYVLLCLLLAASWVVLADAPINSANAAETPASSANKTVATPAAPVAAPATAYAPESVHSSAAVLQVFAGLFAVLLLIFALAWLLRKVGQGGLLSNPHLRILASLALGPRERLVVVEAGSQQLLIGVAPGRITTLHVFDEPLIDATQTPASSDFAKKIQSLMQKNTVTQGVNSSEVQR